jgi:CheY-like chemotaxis protein
MDDSVCCTGSMTACVLVVDDDVALREIVAEAIEAAGYEVRQAENGREALDRMRRESPCIVLLDLMMPVMDGWQVVDEMDADPALAAVPVCVVTAQSQVQPPRHACLLRKPIGLADLLRTVEEHCGKRFEPA